MYWFKHGRDVCIGSNMREMYAGLGEMYVSVQTWERCMYWFKHGRDVCIGSNMGEIYVLCKRYYYDKSYKRTHLLALI